MFGSKKDNSPKKAEEAIVESQFEQAEQPVVQVQAKPEAVLQNLGVIDKLLADPSVDDVLINGHKEIYVERRGKLERTDLQYASEEEVFNIGKKIVEAVDRKLDPRRAMVDARLLDGSRVNIVSPPLAVDGTMISIRKFSQTPITLDIMAEQMNMSPQLAAIFKIAAGSRMNMVISGGTGAGKTTLMNAISEGVSHEERIVTVEDSAELRLNQPHVIRLETRPLDLDLGRDVEVTMRDLVRNALRMRPDRIIVGEVRGQEAFDMMQAMNTGHEGSMTTIHANHPRDALARLENMFMMTDLGIPSKAIKYQIASALNLIVQVSRMRDGKRRITHVTEVVGTEGDVITLQDIFNFIPDNGMDADGYMTGKFKWSGIIPRFARRAIYWGYHDELSKALGVKLPKV